MPTSPESSLVSEMGFLPGPMNRLGVLDKAFQLYEEISHDLTPTKLRTLLTAHSFTMGEGKSKHHYEQEGATPNGHPDLVNLVMKQGYTEHQIFYNDTWVGYIYLRRDEIQSSSNMYD